MKPTPFERQLLKLGVPKKSIPFIRMWITEGPTRDHHYQGAAYHIAPLPKEARDWIEGKAKELPNRHREEDLADVVNRWADRTRRR